MPYQSAEIRHTGYPSPSVRGVLCVSVGVSRRRARGAGGRGTLV